MHMMLKSKREASSPQLSLAYDAADYDGVSREVGGHLAGEWQAMATSATLYVNSRRLSWWGNICYLPISRLVGSADNRVDRDA